MKTGKISYLNGLAIEIWSLYVYRSLYVYIESQ